jgi:membrane protein
MPQRSRSTRTRSSPRRTALQGIVAVIPAAVIAVLGATSFVRAREQDREASAAAQFQAERQPDSPLKPKSPTDLRAPTWGYLVKRTLREFSADRCTDLAAALTYYLVLSLFPGLLALVSLLGLVGQAQEGTDALLGVVEQLAPGGSVDFLRDTVEGFTTSPAVGWGLVIGIVGAVWSASGYVGAFGRALNRMYEVDEGRPVWKLRPMQLLITLITLVLVVASAIILVISGPVAEAIGEVFGLGDTTVLIWSIAKWPVLAVIVVFIVAVLYYATPNIRQPRFRWISLGGALALLILGIATVGFGFYVANFGNYDRTYGSLGGVIVFLLWLWITNLALLFGAEFNSELERGRELQGGIPAETTLQLPPRDTRASDKVAAKERADVAAGAALRRTPRDRSRVGSRTGSARS